MKLFFDTETNGRADFKKPIQDPCQPRLVQLAAILTTDAGEDVSFVKLLIKPDGWTIPAEATDVHGITTEYATKHGLPVKVAVNAFLWMVWAAQSTHAFNHDFDSLVMCNEIFRLGSKNPFLERKPVCEMLEMKPICKLPPNFRGGDYKWPSLQEAYRHAFKREFEKAHDALADIRATLELHRWRINLPRAPVGV